MCWGFKNIQGISTGPKSGYVWGLIGRWTANSWQQKHGTRPQLHCDGWLCNSISIRGSERSKANNEIVKHMRRCFKQVKCQGQKAHLDIQDFGKSSQRTQHQLLRLMHTEVNTAGIKQRTARVQLLSIHFPCDKDRIQEISQNISTGSIFKSTIRKKKPIKKKV